MLDLNKLEDISYVIENLWELIATHKAIGAALELVKWKAKYDKEDVVGKGWLVTYSSYNKYKVRDMDKLMEEYPLELYPNLYNISMSAAWPSIIKDESLLETKEILVTKLKLDE